ncbi:alpha/beta hydrolase family protein [Streptomyces sp. NEAU-Y11]|uniref:alpha/beta hydrolase family protein n=1 Tax=Streptomyces cucumeris TaxID=2962890 RepID=UPI0020C90129|nr:alpha/beta hydrolase [Streptomyces sp. NEAU-Y11]MCP9209215.1 alpha/beta hydrolase [Streptomyces sp. NEAU-Y11]
MTGPRDPAAVTAAEEASLLGLAPVAPDATGAYGEHPDQVVDFHLPPGGAVGGAAPLVLLFHGGAWRAPYDRQHLSPFAAHLASRGFAVASAEYRRGAAPSGAAAPGGEAHREHPPGARHLAGRWPETFDDIAAVMDAVPRLVGESGHAGRVDTGRLVLAGHSAGGHAALWAAARHRLPPGAPWRLSAPPRVHGVVALAPIADLTTARALHVCSDAVDQLLGTGDEGAARLPCADPAALLPTGVRTTVVQGGTDVDVPPQVADSFAVAAAAAGQPVRTVRAAAAGHFPLIDPTAAAVRTVVAEIARIASGDPWRPGPPRGSVPA